MLKAAETVEIAGITLTHPDRVLWPDQGVTKRALAEYYADIADRILPHVVNRPLTLVRCPSGSDGACFVQKHPWPGCTRPFAGSATATTNGWRWMT